MKNEKSKILKDLKNFSILGVLISLIAFIFVSQVAAMGIFLGFIFFISLGLFNYITE
jgi:hypothetical protein